MKLNVSTILKKLAIEVPLEKPNWEKEKELLLKKPVFLKKAQLKDKGSKKKQVKQICSLKVDSFKKI